MPFTIASLLNTPEGPVVGTKRSASLASLDIYNSPNKRRVIYISPDCMSVKTEEEAQEYNTGFSNHLAYTCPGWSYWLPHPGESLPPYEPVPVDDDISIQNTLRGAGLGLGLGVSVPLETIDVEELEHTDGSLAPQYHSDPNPTSSPFPEVMNFNPSPRYVPPSPLDLIAQSLVQSFIAWRTVISPPTSTIEPESKPKSTKVHTTSHYTLDSIPVISSPRFVPPSPTELIVQYLANAFAAWRPRTEHPHEV